ncbi:hypothetical protein M9Y46_00470 [Escherichia coli]|nr:hypothetical protein [Escherichia coli]MCL8411096.1 hypothetical protein [Escherichia coli]MCN3508551.1 hypothetical protein [Escherichia coli]MCN7197466.1 hypothetical protein [Escherichia coli]MCN8528378.1 hypothetical protein [Escherichia coli]MCV0971160.1 hypothetical protein [Escherichia coli]
MIYWELNRALAIL